MEPVHESIFSSTIRSFCKAFAGVIGIALAIVPLILFIGSFNSDYDSAPKIDVKFLPDLEGNTKVEAPSSPVVLQINIHGVIGEEEGTLAEEVDLILTESRKGIFSEDRVRAILLHINTPGGLVTDSDNIYRYLEAYKKKHSIPIYAYVNGLCASGGMYVGCAADKILTSPVSLVGSIGVRMGTYFNISQPLKMLKIMSKSFSEGKGKDEMNPVRPWKEGEGDYIQEIGQFYYKTFVDIVTKSRPNIAPTKLVEEYGAKLFDAPTAKRLGYVDESESSYHQTLNELLVAANIDPSSPYQIVELSGKKPWVRKLFSSDAKSVQKFLRGIFVQEDKLPFSYLHRESSPHFD
ncbi:MAG: S49 family peptidase [Chlamydiota bacterium]